MKFVCVLAVAALAVVSGAPPQPSLPSSFESRIYVDVHIKGPNNETIQADGWYAFDDAQGKALEDYRFQGRDAENVFYLQRYDTGRSYEIDHVGECKVTKVNGTIPPVWGWVKYSQYQGREHFGQGEVDVWTASLGYANVSVGVRIDDPNTPVYLARRGEQRDVFTFFQTFDARTPDPNLFVPPRFCPNNATVARAVRAAGASAAKCVDRGTMIARAQAWVDAKVPYNQGGYYQGYREDCSGFVSMAWELSSSLTTETLPSVSHQIAKADLAPGDVLLDTAEHVVIFGGWTSGQSEYMAYEETKPGEGTVKRATPYPYWYNTAAFVPYRFNNVC